MGWLCTDPESGLEAHRTTSSLSLSLAVKCKRNITEKPEQRAIYSTVPQTPRHLFDSLRRLIKVNRIDVTNIKWLEIGSRLSFVLN